MANYRTAVDLARALQAYGVKRTTSRTGEVSKLLQLERFRKASFDNLFPTMFSLHGLDIEEALDKALADKDITPNAAEYAKAGIYRAMEQIAKAYEVLDQTKLFSIQSKFNNFVTKFNEGGADTLNSSKQKELEAILNQIRKEEFKDPLIVQYVKGTAKRVPSLKLAFTSFKNLRTIVNNVIKKNIESVLKENGVTNSKLLDQNYLTTKIINWGHTQAIAGDNRTFLSGKILAEFLALSPVTSNIKTDELNSLYSTIVQDFVEQTGQEKTSIKISKGNIAKGDPKVLNLIIESGIFQLVRIQNRAENQGDLNTLETKWNIVDTIARKKLLSSLGLSSILDLANKLLRVRSSPNTLEDIAETIANTISGKKLRNTSKVIKLPDIINPIKKKRIKVKVKSNKTVNLRKASGTTRTTSNLTALQNLLNANLVDQVKRNMGNGTRSDVLNLQTGRFAESVEVTRLSESRQGMITAFYTYMKNPYATFSAGGRQEFPRSRDPKTLISRSIREIAAEQVSNRLRSVLV